MLENVPAKGATSAQAAHLYKTQQNAGNANKSELDACRTCTAAAIPFGVCTRTAAVLRDGSRAERGGGYGVIGVAAPHQPPRIGEATKVGGIGEGTGDVPRLAAPMAGSLDKSMITCGDELSPIWATDLDPATGLMVSAKSVPYDL